MAEVYMAGDFRNGTTFEMDGNVFKVVEFQHVKHRGCKYIFRIKTITKFRRTNTNR